jgi:hypothetical protein
MVLIRTRIAVQIISNYNKKNTQLYNVSNTSPLSISSSLPTHLPFYPTSLASALKLSSSKPSLPPLAIVSLPKDASS